MDYFVLNNWMSMIYFFILFLRRLIWFCTARICPEKWNARHKRSNWTQLTLNISNPWQNLAFNQGLPLNVFPGSLESHFYSCSLEIGFPSENCVSMCDKFASLNDWITRQFNLEEFILSTDNWHFEKSTLTSISLNQAMQQHIEIPICLDVAVNQQLVRNILEKNESLLFQSQLHVQKESWKIFNEIPIHSCKNKMEATVYSPHINVTLHS